MSRANGKGASDVLGPRRSAVLSFVKMEGAGNDYIYLDGVREPLPDLDWAAVARRVSDRRFGVGGDGLILVVPGERAPVRMVMYNADGSRGRMCGNGVRCVAKLAHDRGYAASSAFSVETDAGLVAVELVDEAEDGRPSRVRVDMGPPVLAVERIPARLSGAGGAAPTGLEREAVVRRPLPVLGCEVPVTLVSMGNPHCVVFLEDWLAATGAQGRARERGGGAEPGGEEAGRVEAVAAHELPERLAGLALAEIGPSFERHPAFPEGVNTEFVVVLAPDRLRMRVWERGSGETWACGTGACAALVAGRLAGRTARRAAVEVRGGELEVEWRKDDGHVILAGPAREVFRGEWRER